MISSNDVDSGKVPISDEDDDEEDEDCNKEEDRTDRATFTTPDLEDEVLARVSFTVGCETDLVDELDVNSLIGTSSTNSRTELLGILQYRNNDELSRKVFLNFNPNGRVSEAGKLNEGKKSAIADSVADLTVSLGVNRRIFLLFL